MNKKNGFTLVELLIVIVIIGILSAFAISATTKYISTAKKEKENQNINTAKMAAESYAQANKKILPQVIGDKREISFNELKSSNYLKEEIKNQKDELCMDNSYVLIVKVDDNKYAYKPSIACGSESKKDVTTNSTNPDIAISINSINHEGEQTTDVSNAYFTIVLKGDKDNSSIKIVSYNFMVYEKNIDKGETEFTEVFNSGSIKGNKLETIKVEDIPISQYLDFTGKTEVKITASLLNEEGDIVEDESYIKINDTSSSITYMDDEPPVCPDNPLDREGEPEPEDWYNKKNIGDGQIRTISLKCNDNNGSGCKRIRFSKTWPEEKGNYRTIKDSSIVLQDNSEYSEDTSCSVRVNIDVVSPEIKVLRENKFAKEIVLEKNSDIKELNPTMNVKSTDEFYTDLINLDADNKKYKWLNKANFPNGMTYSIVASDDIDIRKIIWKVNQPGKGEMERTTSISNEGLNVDLDNPDTIPESLNYRTEVEDVYNAEGAKIGEKKVHKFNVSLSSEGARYGELTVADKAGNKSTITFEAYIDLTPPTTPVMEMHKWKNNNITPTPPEGLQDVYRSETWSNKKIYTEVHNSKDNFEFSHYEYKMFGDEGTETNHRNNKKNITKDGITNIYYRACDNAKNCTDYNDSGAIVMIDTVAPTVEVTPKKIDEYITEANGKINYTSVSTNVHNGSETVGQDSTGHITIRSDQYIDLVNGWMNKENYPQGVAYDISITDNTSHLYGYKWDVASNVKTNDTTIPIDSEVNKISGSRYGSGVNSFVLVDNGERYARLYVRDNAGNYTFAHLYANIDNSDPTGSCTYTYNYKKNSDNFLKIDGISDPGTTKTYRYVSKFETNSTKKNYLKCGITYRTEMKITDKAGNSTTVNCTNNGNESITIPDCCSSTIKTEDCSATWGECSASCGGGTRTGTRVCKTKSAYDDSNCASESESVEESCNTQSCCLKPYYSGATETTAIYSGSDWPNGIMGWFYGDSCLYSIAESKDGVKVRAQPGSTLCDDIKKSSSTWVYDCVGWVYKGCFQEYRTTHTTCRESL